jgi:hypothetical protein
MTIKTKKPAQPGNYRDQAWKTIIYRNLLPFLSFFAPDLLLLWDRTKEIKTQFDRKLVMEGAVTDKGSRLPDVTIAIPTLDGGTCGMLCFVEQQHAKDASFPKRFFEIFIRYRAERPEGMTTGFVIYTGPQNRDRVSVYSESTNEIKIRMEFKTYSVLDSSLEEPKKDDALFSIVMHIARLELEAGGDRAKREETGKKILELVSGLNLPQNEKADCLTFAYRLLRLFEAEVDAQLKEAYNMDEAVKFEDSLVLSGEMKGLARGIKQGLAKGRQEGRQEGLQEGRQEGHREKALEIAKSLLSSNRLPVSIIAQSTGLTEEDVLSLQTAR